MKALALILFCFCSCAHAQLAMLAQQVTATAWSGYPTNQAGCLGWWSADNGWNAAGLTWTNWSIQVTNAGKIDLTNTVAGSTPTYTASFLNSHAVLYFDGTDDFLQNVNHKVTTPYDVFAVWMRTNDAGTSSHIMVDSTVAANRFVFEMISVAGLTRRLGAFYSGGSDGWGVNGFSANSALVTRTIFDATTAAIYTNNVLLLSTNLNAPASMDGITIGGRYTPTASRYFQGYIAEIITYTNTLAAAAASNVTAYLWAKYNISH